MNTFVEELVEKKRLQFGVLSVSSGDVTQEDTLSAIISNALE